MMLPFHTLTYLYTMLTSNFLLVLTIIISVLTKSVWNNMFGSFPEYDDWDQDDPNNYNHLNLNLRTFTRRGRSLSKNVKSVRNEYVYAFQNLESNSYLTSLSSPGKGVLSSVILKPWKALSTQLWEVVSLAPYNTGFCIKPLTNELNEISSRLVNNSHAYYPWTFWKRKSDGLWLIRTEINGKKVCIRSQNVKRNRWTVNLQKCNENDGKQIWKIQDVDEDFGNQ